MFVIFIPVFVLLFLAAQMVVIGETKGFLNAIGSIHWGLMMTVFSLGHLAYILVLPSHRNPMGGSRALVLFLVAITQINDIAHTSIDILGEKYFRNRERILPSLRPLKTLEGFLISTAITVICSWYLAPYLTPLKSYEALSLGLILAIGGFIGDMVISSVKKDLDVKELDNQKGNQLFSHRGIMNRIDSLTYTAPLFFHFIYYFKY
jgi:phosphatidate cytidylyltransferase